jgi:hypothetical protein
MSACAKMALRQSGVMERADDVRFASRADIAWLGEIQYCLPLRCLAQRAPLRLQEVEHVAVVP